MADRDIRLLVTVRMYDAEPAEVIEQMKQTPGDPQWHSTAHGEFEILDVELAPDGGDPDAQ